MRRILYSSKLEPCIEAARLIAGNPYAFDIEVCYTSGEANGSNIDWKPYGIGEVLVKPNVPESLKPFGWEPAPQWAKDAKEADQHQSAPISDGFTDQRDEDEADQEHCDRAAGRA